MTLLFLWDSTNIAVEKYEKQKRASPFGEARFTVAYRDLMKSSMEFSPPAPA